MDRHVITIDKKHIPDLLGILGKALSDGRDVIIEKRVHESGEYIFVNDEFMGGTGEDPISLQDFTAGIQPYSEQEISEMEDEFFCTAINATIDRYSCKKGLCGYKNECLSAGEERSGEGS